MKNHSSVYVRKDGKTYWLASVTFQDVRNEPGAIVDYGLGRIFREKGVVQSHVTYPFNGSAHQSYLFSDRKKLMVFQKKTMIEMPRDVSNVQLLTKQEIEVFAFITPPMFYPKHSEIKSEDYNPLPVSGLPLEKITDLPEHKGSFSNKDQIYECHKREGTLNWSVSFLGDNITERWDAIFEKYYIFGNKKPYVLVSVSVQ